MGLDIHALNLIRYVASSRPLGRVATIGRQELAIDNRTREACGVSPSERYCESLICKLGAEAVHSFDISDYEDATHIVDLNNPYEPPELYDVILDFGSLEHVWDQPTAFRNVAGLGTIGSTICHVLPVNNLAGHGLWQYSSDLLYEIYSEQNGFAGTEVFYASALDPRYWYRVKPAAPGVRTQFASIEPIILLSRSTKRSGHNARITVYQKFYDDLWSEKGGKQANGTRPSPGLAQSIKRSLRSNIGPYLLVRNLVHTVNLAAGRGRHSLSPRNQSFERLRVDHLVGNVQ